MKIRVSSGIGHGPTELSAFDQALVKAGIANLNLVYLSSIIPPNGEIVVDEKPRPFVGNWGDRLYTVMAQLRSSRRDEEVWAGIGWVQNTESGKGLLVEHEGHSERQVVHDIEHSLAALIHNRAGEKFSPVEMKVVGATCHDKPVCALVVAAFKTEGWK